MAFHLFNLLVHTLNAWLVYLLLSERGRERAHLILTDLEPLLRDPTYIENNRTATKALSMLYRLVARAEIAVGDNVTAVCQGFIGSGIAGEALLIFNESSFKDIAELMKYEGTIDESVELELLMDISNVLIGACLKGIVDQLDINFSQGHPMVLGRHIKVADLLKGNAMKWKQTFAIEMGYRIENRHINCDLLLLFTEDSMDAMRRHVWHLIE